MDDFRSKDGELHCEDVPVSAIADAVGTPVFIYSKKTLVDHFRRLRDAFSEVTPLIRYAVKANSNLAILKVLADEGAGFDVVSKGEIYRVLQAGGRAEMIDFAGVGKTRDEIAYALEGRASTPSTSSRRASSTSSTRPRSALGTTARHRAARQPRRRPPDAHLHRDRQGGVASSASTSPAPAPDRRHRSKTERVGVRLTGIHVHIGSQITQVGPHVEMVQKRRSRARRKTSRDFAPARCKAINIGGGFGIHYRDDDEAPAMTDYAEPMVPLLKESGFEVHMEPGPHPRRQRGHPGGARRLREEQRRRSASSSATRR